MSEHVHVEQVEAVLEGLSVGDVLLHTASTVATIAYSRLEPAERDLEQVRLAIDALQLLLPLLESDLPDDVRRDFRSAVAALQLAYVNAV